LVVTSPCPAESSHTEAVADLQCRWALWLFHDSAAIVFAAIGSLTFGKIESMSGLINLVMMPMWALAVV
jgi:hypothetical protein